MADAIVQNAADAGQVESAKKIERRQQLEWEDALKWLTTDPRGVCVLRKLFARCGIFKVSFTGNSTTFFNDGMKDVGLWLFDEVLAVNPQAALKAIVKQQHEEKTNA